MAVFDLLKNLILILYNSMNEFSKNQQEFWVKMDNPQFWEKIKPPRYIRTPCSTFNHCNRVCKIVRDDYVIEVLWDYAKKRVLIHDGTWYHLTHSLISELTIRQVVIGLGFDYMETEWSDNGNDVLDILVHQAPLSTIRILTLDDTCEKL